MTFYTLYVISGLISTAHGSGKHQDTLSNYDLSIAMKHWWLCYLWYNWSMIFARLSIGIFFLRLTVKLLQRYLIYFIMVSTVAFGLIFMGVAIGECTPPSYFWDKTIEGWCMDTRIIVALMYLYSSSSLFSDVAFAIFPIFLMKGLQMDKKTKYALIPILGIGWIASIAVLIRFGFLVTLSSPDFTYDAMTIAVLSSAEQGLAITAGNLATLRPLFTRKFRLWDSIVLDHSGGHHPPTIGALDRAKGRAASNTGSVSLATFMRGEADEEESMSGVERHNSGDGQGKNGIAVTTDIEITSQRRSDICRSARNDGNESQEELHTKPSRETLDTDIKAVPKSFLDKGGGLRDSAET
ncbi:putative Integral membrane protein [Seiridium unicorne]|uniref:Integral membrane protein n=1 Tax=Seiridium unicorne TaxID=138068 RepID=A0ABR2UV48_9PEZI